MRKIYLPFLILSFTFCATAQSDCGWSYINTASNSTIAILDINFEFFTINYGLSQPIETLVSDLDCLVTIGVFFSDDNGNLVCGGQTTWNNTSSMALSAWGDDPTTNEKDGFDTGEPYFFKLCVDGVEYNQEEVLMSVEAPFSNAYTTNGMANILSINFNAMGNASFCNTTNKLYSCVFNEGCSPDSNGTFLTIAECEEFCFSNNLFEKNQEKELIKKIDIYGRTLPLKYNTGFAIEIYTDQSVSKKYNY